MLLLNAREVVREDGGEKLILLVLGDITEKRKAEEKLEQILKVFLIKSHKSKNLPTATVPSARHVSLGSIISDQTVWPNMTSLSSKMGKPGHDAADFLIIT